jgi:hypothetical protein
MADDFAKLLLGYQQPRADLAFNLIAGPPAFHVAANGFDDRERPG